MKLKCNKNCHDHIDYLLPIKDKGPDFRTSYYKSHDYIHPIPQDFDCRVKPTIKKDLLEKNIRIKEELIPLSKKDYREIAKQEDLLIKYGHADLCSDVHYLKTFQEKASKEPPPSGIDKASETKDSYRPLPWSPTTREMVAPVDAYHCEISGLARPLQPVIPVERPGHWKHLDIYMSQKTLAHRPFTEDEFLGARKHLPTAYNTSTNKNATYVLLGGPLSGNSRRLDKDQTPDYPKKNLSSGLKRGMQSEYKRSYIPQTYSDMSPYLYDTGVVFPCATRNTSSPWQIFAIPGMYCTENCHIGTGYSVKSILDCLRSEDKHYYHKALKPEQYARCSV